MEILNIYERPIKVELTDRTQKEGIFRQISYDIIHEIINARLPLNCITTTAWQLERSSEFEAVKLQNSDIDELIKEAKAIDGPSVSSALFLQLIGSLDAAEWKQACLEAGIDLSEDSGY